MIFENNEPLSRTWRFDKTWLVSVSVYFFYCMPLRRPDSHSNLDQGVPGILIMYTTKIILCVLMMRSSKCSGDSRCCHCEATLQEIQAHFLSRLIFFTEAYDISDDRRTLLLTQKHSNTSFTINFTIISSCTRTRLI